MKIQDQVRQMRDETPGVTLAAFGDLSSGLILNWSAPVQHPREVLDLLGEKAVESLGFAAAWPDRPAGLSDGLAVQFTEGATQVFVRAGAEDVVCAACAAGENAEPALAAAARLAHRLAGA